MLCAALPCRLPPAAPGAEVNMPWEDAWGATNGKGKMEIKNYPPTVFYQMQRDLQTKRQIEKALEIFKKNNINADSIFVSATRAGGCLPACLFASSSPAWHPLPKSSDPRSPTHAPLPHPLLPPPSPPPPARSQIPARRITPEWMSDRSLLLTEDQSRQIQKAMIKVGALDKNGNLNYDPRLVSQMAGALAPVAGVAGWEARWCVPALVSQPASQPSCLLLALHRLPCCIPCLPACLPACSRPAGPRRLQRYCPGSSATAPTTT